MMDQADIVAVFLAVFNFWLMVAFVSVVFPENVLSQVIVCATLSVVWTTEFTRRFHFTASRESQVVAIRLFHPLQENVAPATRNVGIRVRRNILVACCFIMFYLLIYLLVSNS